MTISGIGKLVQDRRERMGLSQKELARRLEKDDSWISRLETGVTKRMLEPDEIASLAAVLGLKEADLLKAGGYLQDDQAINLADPDVQFFTNQIEQLTPEQQDAVEAIIRQFRKLQD